MTFSRKGGEKKGWKAFQADYDYVFSLSDRVCSYCLTDQQVAALMSMTEFLSWSTRWVKAEGDIDQELIIKFTDGLERNLMSGCCDDNLPIQYRYSPAGVLQRSLNGGGNWTDAPEYDPRVYSPQFPPIAGDDGDDKKCIAATGAAALVKEQIGDQLTDDMSRYTLSQLIKDWVGTMIESSNPFQALVTVITNQVFALIISALRPALTDEVYDIFKCILYCRMANNASFNDAQWTSVRSDITSKISGIAGIFLEHLVYLLGTGGLTNLVRAGGATEGDCSDCTDCPTPHVFFHINSDPAPAHEIFPDELGIYTVTCDAMTDGGYYGLVSFSDNTGTPFTPCGQIIHMSGDTPEVYFTYDCVTGANHGDSECYWGKGFVAGAPWTFSFTVTDTGCYTP